MLTKPMNPMNAVTFFENDSKSVQKMSKEIQMKLKKTSIRDAKISTMKKTLFEAVDSFKNDFTIQKVLLKMAETMQMSLNMHKSEKGDKVLISHDNFWQVFAKLNRTKLSSFGAIMVALCILSEQQRKETLLTWQQWRTHIIDFAVRFCTRFEDVGQKENKTVVPTTKPLTSETDESDLTVNCTDLDVHNFATPSPSD